MGTADLVKIIRDEIIATYMEDNQEATPDEALEFAASQGAEVVEAFVHAVKLASTHYISSKNMNELISTIVTTMKK
jgi:5-formyltetrahydrofolate cyclo-ligase